MQTNNFWGSKTLGIIILAGAGAVILVLVFSLGVFVGNKRAEFSFKWAQAYRQNFGGPAGGIFGEISGRDLTDANGVFGKIIKIDGQTLTIDGKDNMEKIVLASDKTAIKFQRKTEKLSDLNVGDNIVVVGDPNTAGQIAAELIRVMPPPPSNKLN